MRRTYLLLFLGIPLLQMLPGCSAPPDFWAEAKSNQKRVLVSFPPLYAITTAIAGEDAYALSMLTGTGPHEYDPAPNDLIKLNKADLFIYNGLSLDDAFVHRMLQSHRNKGLAVLNVGAALEKEDHEREEKKEPGILIDNDEKEHDHGDHKHKHGEHDPHVWLGPDQAMFMTEIIAAKLVEIDPEHKKGYEKRKTEFLKELQKLKADGLEKLKDKKNKSIVTTHEAFGYFAKAFDVKIVGSIQLRPGMDPDAVKMKELIELCQKDKVRVIAKEPQYSGAPAEALKRNLKAKGVEVEIIDLDPLETAPVAAGKKYNPDPGYYLKKMRENIDTLAKALP